MQTYSVTQGSNLAAIIGVIMLLLNLAKVNVSQDEIQTLIGGILAVAGIVISFINRYKKGDLKLSGVRKNGQDLPSQGII